MSRMHYTTPKWRQKAEDHGVLRKMTPQEFSGFRRMLRRLRKKLNNPVYFEQLVQNQAEEIRIRHVCQDWEDGPLKFAWNGSVTYKYGDDLARTRARKYLGLLRHTLNDRATFDQLSLLGVYSFIFSEEEDEGVEEGILLSNHTGIYPNADWSISHGDPRRGLAYGEIWFHS